MENDDRLHGKTRKKLLVNHDLLVNKAEESYVFANLLWYATSHRVALRRRSSFPRKQYAHLIPFVQLRKQARFLSRVNLLMEHQQ